MRKCFNGNIFKIHKNAVYQAERRSQELEEETYFLQDQLEEAGGPNAAQVSKNIKMNQKIHHNRLMSGMQKEKSVDSDVMNDMNK